MFNYLEFIAGALIGSAICLIIFGCYELNKLRELYDIAIEKIKNL
jgi:hypothetical protein